MITVGSLEESQAVVAGLRERYETLGLDEAAEWAVAVCSAGRALVIEDPPGDIVTHAEAGQ